MDKIALDRTTYQAAHVVLRRVQRRPAHHDESARVPPGAWIAVLAQFVQHAPAVPKIRAASPTPVIAGDERIDHLNSFQSLSTRQVILATVQVLYSPRRYVLEQLRSRRLLVLRQQLECDGRRFPPCAFLRCRVPLLLDHGCRI